MPPLEALVRADATGDRSYVARARPVTGTWGPPRGAKEPCCPADQLDLRFLHRQGKIDELQQEAAQARAEADQWADAATSTEPSSG
jgi:hypothetical protein